MQGPRRMPPPAEFCRCLRQRIPPVMLRCLFSMLIMRSFGAKCGWLDAMKGLPRNKLIQPPIYSIYKAPYPRTTHDTRMYVVRLSDDCCSYACRSRHACSRAGRAAGQLACRLASQAMLCRYCKS